MKELAEFCEMYSEFKFPKSRWPELRKAEALTPEGDVIWESLRNAFLDTYFKEPEPAINKVND